MKALFIIILSALAVKAHTQRSLDAILSSLNNKDVYVSFITHASYIGSKAPDSTLNRDSAMAAVRFFKVVSLEEDIKELAQIFERKTLVEKLYCLLQDSSRDLYANVLLYDLLDNHKLGKFLFDNNNRREWIESGEKLKDEQKWKAFIDREFVVMTRRCKPVTS